MDLWHQTSREEIIVVGCYKQRNWVTSKNIFLTNRPCRSFNVYFVSACICKNIIYSMGHTNKENYYYKLMKFERGNRGKTFNWQIGINVIGIIKVWQWSLIGFTYGDIGFLSQNSWILALSLSSNPVNSSKCVGKFWNLQETTVFRVIYRLRIRAVASAIDACIWGLSTLHSIGV